MFIPINRCAPYCNKKCRNECILMARVLNYYYCISCIFDVCTCVHVYALILLQQDENNQASSSHLRLSLFIFLTNIIKKDRNEQSAVYMNVQKNI